MKATAITNSLLRIDGVTGIPPSPFERPNEKMGFFVLELGTHTDVSKWCARTVKVLSRNQEFLRKIHTEGAQVTLFVESASSAPVVRFEASFLSLLAGAGIALEWSREV
jgi:hypothetical protein